jgi:hypothetical protein
MAMAATTFCSATTRPVTPGSRAISGGAFAGWHQVGGSDTNYSVVAIGDYFGNGTSDILFRNNGTGDTWYEALSNGNFAGWHQIGGSNPSYTVKT